jgi:hypothetical protein
MRSSKLNEVQLGASVGSTSGGRPGMASDCSDWKSGVIVCAGTSQAKQQFYPRWRLSARISWPAGRRTGVDIPGRQLDAILKKNRIAGDFLKRPGR